MSFSLPPIINGAEEKYAQNSLKITKTTIINPDQTICYQGTFFFFRKISDSIYDMYKL